MNTSPSLKKRKELGTRFAAGLTVILASAALTGRAVADPPVTMAPPIESSNGQVSDDGSGDVSRNSVFNWGEIPENQQVPIRRAVFDRGGYQLYDTVGETIVVPFTNNNLYVMKFAVSPDGSTYFVHTDGAPVLYIPRGSSLENASVPGARWYPFSENFHPSTPIFLGIAPSYSDFIGMGWYPDMYCYGGYYGHRSFLAGGIFLPSFGLEFVIGGRSYDGWEPYHHYYHEHSAPYRLTIIDNNYYRGSYHHDDVFRGGHGGYDNRSFRGGDHGGYAYHSYGGGHTYSGGGHTFRGAGDGWSHQSNGGTHSFGGSQTYGGGTHTFQGGRYGGSSDHGYGGGSSDHNYGGSHGSFGGARQVDPQVHSQYSGGQRPAFSGGQHPAYSDGRSSAGYSRPSGGGGYTRPSGDSGANRASSGGGNSRASSDGGGHDRASGGGGGRGDGGGDHGGDHNR